MEPITKTEAKDYMKVDFTDDDMLIESTLIPSARQMAEKWLNRSLITQTLQAYYSSFGDKVYLPFSPVQSVTSVKRILLNVTTTLTVNEDYYVQGLDDKFLMMSTPYRLQPGQSPTDILRHWELQVEYKTGYGDAGSEVPEIILEAIRKIVATNYEMRQNSSDTQHFRMPDDAKKLLSGYRKLTI